jgi:hypothetical protein
MNLRPDGALHEDAAAPTEPPPEEVLPEVVQLADVKEAIEFTKDIA